MASCAFVTVFVFYFPDDRKYEADFKSDWVLVKLFCMIRPVLLLYLLAMLLSDDINR